MWNGNLKTIGFCSSNVPPSLSLSPEHTFQLENSEDQLRHRFWRHLNLIIFLKIFEKEKRRHRSHSLSLHLAAWFYGRCAQACRMHFGAESERERSWCETKLSHTLKWIWPLEEGHFCEHLDGLICIEATL